MARSRSAFFGGLAAAGITEVADQAARALLGTPSLPELAANLLTSSLPTATFGAVLVTLRYSARPALLIGLVVGLLVVGGGAGVVLAWARPRSALGGGGWAPVVALSLLTGAVSALLLLPPSSLWVPGPNAAWLLLREGLFVAICLRLTAAAGIREDAVAGPSRRLFLEQVGLLAAGAVVGVAVFKGLSDLARDYLSSTPTGKVGPFATLAPAVTPTDSFYVVSKNLLGDPQIGGTGWQLELSGHRQLRLDQAQLLRLSDARQLQTLECISNQVGGDLIGTGDWEGVRLATLLRLAAGDRGFRYVVFKAADGYADSLPLEVALEPSTMIALRMNGAILPSRHGYPARLLIPGRYGMKNVKWLTSVEATVDDQLGYWELRGWSRDAVVKTMSRFDLPAPGRVHQERPILLAGVAYAGRRGISSVQVRTGEGEWVEATVDAAVSEFSWSIWRLEWQPERGGRHTLEVRAADSAGRMQAERREVPIPNGSTGYHRVTVDT